MDELKQCPFCGSKNVTVYHWPGDLQFCFCLDQMCGTEGPKATTRAKAIELWNTRPEEDRLLKLLGKALEEEEK